MGSEGFHVCEARTAEDTVRLAQDKNIGLIVLDTMLWQLKRMNVLSTLQQHPETKNIPVMLLGEPRSRQDITVGLQAGATEWIMRKGFEVNKFLNKLHTIFETRTVRNAPAGEQAPKSDPARRPASLGKLSLSNVTDVLNGVEHLTAFEFNILDAITSTCSKVQTTKHISDIAIRDPALTIALLSVANTLENAETHDGGVVDPSKAIEMVGAKRFYIIAESVVPIKVNPRLQWDPGHFWAHSVATSRIAGLVARRLRLGTPGEAMAAGLLHDAGYAILANHSPNHLDMLLKAASECDQPSTDWEKELIGLHHGEIAAGVFKQLGLPDLLQDVTLVHHEPVSSCTSLKSSARVTAFIIQAADRIADVMFPGDPPLSLVGNLPKECEDAFANADISPADIIHEARGIMAELITEMTHHFPNTITRPWCYRKKPIPKLLYYVPSGLEFDIVKTFFEVRCSELRVLEELKAPVDWPRAPVVVNLSHMGDMEPQIEVLSSLMASGLMRERKGIVLLKGPTSPVHQKFASDLWRILSTPTPPLTWMPWLADDGNTNAQAKPQTNVA